MARKKKDFPPKRERKVTVRFTMEAYEAIEKYASLAKVSVSEYIRNLALNKKPTITYETTFDSTELLKVLGDMGKIGSNLNQIARHLNEGGTLKRRNILKIFLLFNISFKLVDYIPLYHNRLCFSYLTSVAEISGFYFKLFAYGVYHSQHRLWRWSAPSQTIPYGARKE